MRAAAPAGAPKRGSVEAKIEAKRREIERRESSVSLAFDARTRTGSRIQSSRESKARAALSQARSELRELERQQSEAAAPAPAPAAPETPAAPARTAGTPHHPALTGSNPFIPAGAGRMGMDIMHFEDPREGGNGSSTGRMYLPGYDPEDVGEGEVYVRQERPGAPWVASDLPGGMPDQSARTPQELMARVARLYGISGEMHIDDERVGVRRSHSGVTRVEPAPQHRFARIRQMAEQGAGRPMVDRLREANPVPVERRAAIPPSPAQPATRSDGRPPTRFDLLREMAGNGGAPVRRPSGTGPGRVAVGGTDADRRAARPRLEIDGRPESDRAYEIRTAPTRDAALRLLNGHQLAGLRSFARAEGVVTSGTKKDLVARLIRVLRDRHEDSAAITRMVNNV